MKLRTLVGTATALLALPAVSMAEFNYTSAEFNYVLDVEIDVGPGSIDGDGFSLGGSYEIADNFFISGYYDDYSLDFNVDGEWLEVGGGYFHTLDDDLDFVATLSYAELELSSGGMSTDTDGIVLGGGIRAQLGDKLQVDAMLEYFDFENSDTGIELRGRYYINPQFSAQLKLKVVSDVEIISIGVRTEFGGRSSAQ